MKKTVLSRASISHKLSQNALQHSRSSPSTGKWIVLLGLTLTAFYIITVFQHLNFGNNDNIRQKLRNQDTTRKSFGVPPMSPNGPDGQGSNSPIQSVESSYVWICKDSTGFIKEGLLNDNYCDCFDGSDEPDTSACSATSVHRHDFICNKQNMHSQRIFTSRVGDGVEDCFNGADEA